MVKVLLFQLFNRQNVVACEQEPVDTAVISDEAFLVATRQGDKRLADRPRCDRRRLTWLPSFCRVPPPQAPSKHTRRAKNAR